MTAQENGFRSGFVAIIGRPNVGKSTLLNTLLGQKVAIMSDKPQTTRNRIVGVLHRPDAQIVFLDTPGMHKPLHRLGEQLNRIAEGAVPDADVVLYMVDGTVPVGEGDRLIASRLAQAGRPTVLVVNKVDRLPRPQWYAAMDAYKALAPEGFEWLDVVPVSALQGRNVPDLVGIIQRHLPPGPRYFPEEMVTDQPERQLIQELIREQVLHRTRDEVPHSVAVMVEQMVPRENGVIYVAAVVLVERESQKGILIGEKGRMIRQIGAAARAEIEGLLGSRIFLELFVKVKEDWRNRPSVLRELGLETD